MKGHESPRSPRAAFGWRRRIGTVLVLLATAASLAGCEIRPEPVALVERAPVWVPGHWAPGGYWIGGHWR